MPTWKECEAPAGKEDLLELVSCLFVSVSVSVKLSLNQLLALEDISFEDFLFYF